MVEVTVFHLWRLQRPFLFSVLFARRFKWLDNKHVTFLSCLSGHLFLKFEERRKTKNATVLQTRQHDSCECWTRQCARSCSVWRSFRLQQEKHCEWRSIAKLLVPTHFASGSNVASREGKCSQSSCTKTVLWVVSASLTCTLKMRPQLGSRRVLVSCPVLGCTWVCLAPGAWRNASWDHEPWILRIMKSVCQPKDILLNEDFWWEIPTQHIYGQLNFPWDALKRRLEVKKAKIVAELAVFPPDLGINLISCHHGWTSCCGFRLHGWRWWRRRKPSKPLA